MTPAAGCGIMKLRRHCRGLTPVGLKPSIVRLRQRHKMNPNRQRIHLAEPKHCLDEAGHRSLPAWSVTIKS
jgi:hypothetical protein